jgi:ribose transport system ATP-binding protein
MSAKLIGHIASDAMPPILQMSAISKRFPGVVALEEVNLEVHPGEIVALIGENGAGKSTLMKILGGVIQPDSGSIELNGEKVVIDSPREASRRGIEFIHQELSILDNLDVAANIFLRREPTRSGWLKLIDNQRLYHEADTLLKRLGLNITSRTPLAKLSIAQQQLVEIARAVSAGARMVIMDEPTSSLTLSEVRSLIEIVRDLKASGVSIVYISHRLHEVQEIADRAVVLRDGHNAGELPRTEINHDRMVRMMVGRELKDLFKSEREKKPGTSSVDWFSVRGFRTLRYPQEAVSISLGRGEVLGLAGLVGAGRTELAETIFGVEPALAGEISLDGKRIAINGPSDSIEQGIYLVPEDRRTCGLIVDLNIRENISLPALNRFARLGLIQFGKEKAAAKQACQSINVKTPSIEMKAANLSGGNQQKVVLAKWLALSPRVLIFDEPTRGIDVGAKAEIYALIRELSEQGVSIIVISSEMEEVLGISDRIAIMHEGRITGIIEREQFSEEAVMAFATGSNQPAHISQ